MLLGAGVQNKFCKERIGEKRGEEAEPAPTLSCFLS